MCGMRHGVAGELTGQRLEPGLWWRRLPRESWTKFNPRDKLYHQADSGGEPWSSWLADYVMFLPVRERGYLCLSLYLLRFCASIPYCCTILLSTIRNSGPIVIQCRFYLSVFNPWNISYTLNTAIVLPVLL